MSYDGKLLSRARENYESDKSKHEAAFYRRREEIYGRVPRLAEIDAALRGTMSRVIAASLRRGENVTAAVEQQRRENLSLQEERKRLLAEAGYAADALTLQPLCERCSDTGYGPDGGMCECLKRYYVAEQNRELSKLLNIGEQSFDTFRMEYYSHEKWPGYNMSPYDNMELIRATCCRYAASFNKGSGSLFLTGTPGLGKTFLSACIAREVSARGFSVVYDTAGHVFTQFETSKFRRLSEEEQEEAAADVRRYLECDLLIVDDLGTELVTPFVQDVLYQLINSRIVGEKSTIINSNLDAADIYKRYSPQIASRLSGEYRTLRFFGDDIRKMKQPKGF